MSQPRKLSLVGAALLLGLAAGASSAGGASSAPSTSAATPPAAAGADDKSSAADANTKRLLLLMDTDKSGKVSRQEFMSYMAAEFDRLDKNKDGELDVDELTRLHLRAGTGVHR